MFVSHSPQEFISNCPTLCAHQILAMVLISLSAKSLPGHQPNSSTQPPGASAARARHALPAFFPLWRRLHPCIQVYRGNSTKKARLYILNLAHTPDNFFSPFLSLYSAATAGHKNGVEGHKDGVKKAVLVTRAEWRSHERSEQDRSLVTLESQKRSEAGILKCSCDRNYRNIL
jgi:hypothetical protein